MQMIFNSWFPLLWALSKRPLDMAVTYAVWDTRNNGMEINGPFGA